MLFILYKETNLSERKLVVKILIPHPAKLQQTLPGNQKINTVGSVGGPVCIDISQGAIMQGLVYLLSCKSSAFTRQPGLVAGGQWRAATPLQN